MTRAEQPEPRIAQHVTAVSGFAYGVIGADLHVFADRGPVYLLRSYRPHPKPGIAWLLEQPSRMLNARYAVVGFTGRDQELESLASWRDAGGSRLSARWLHAPGGQGKTRLADAFARQSAAANWKVITAAHGPGSVLDPPGSQDLRLQDAAGVLLVVDYADRWPASHLAWLFSNALLYREVPARLLLVARTAYAWPAVRAGLDNHQADTDDQLLAPLPDEPGGRLRMFTVARSAFGSHYGIADPSGISPPGSLDHPEFGLTLAVHMAALVAVDAAARNDRAPAEMAGLTTYLLDRESAHWRRLHENRKEGLEFDTPPSVMARAVFTAALTGAVNHQEGSNLLSRLNLGVPASRILSDHSVCYPPADPGASTVLEPLYPDRLAEDFLALALPGHDLNDHPPDPWSAAAPVTLLTPAAAQAPPYTPRAVTFLAAATARWPHVGSRHLYPLLRRDPELAMRAGSAALTALAELPTAPVALLEAIAAHFPDGRHTDLDAGIAAVTRRLADQHLATTRDPLDKVGVLDNLAMRLSHAGLDQEAVDAAQDSVRYWRGLAQADATAHEPDLARALVNLGVHLRRAGWRDRAVALAQEAVDIFRRLAAANPETYAPHRAGALSLLGTCLHETGRREEGILAAEEAVAAYRRLAKADPVTYEHSLGSALDSLGAFLRQAGRSDEAIRAAEEDVAIRRRLAMANPAEYEPDLAGALNNLGNQLIGEARNAEALRAAEEAVAIDRRLAGANPVAYEPDLVAALNTYGRCLRQAGQRDQALAPTEEAVQILRRLVPENPALHEPTLAIALDNLSGCLAETENGRRKGEAVAPAEEATGICRRLAAANPAAYEPELARIIYNLGTRLFLVGRWNEAVTSAEEAVSMGRRLAQANPAAHEPGLAAELGSLGMVLPMVGRRDEGLAALAESIGIHRRLAATSPAVYQADLARTLVIQASAYAAVPADTARSRAAITEAIGIFSRLTDRQPETFRAYLDEAHRVRRNLGIPEESQRGADIQAEATLSFEQAIFGTVVSLHLPSVSRTVTTRLRASVHDGQRIRFRGQGSPGPGDGPPGDLYVTIRVQPHKVFSRDGDNLIITVPLSRAEAADGADVQVPLADGRPITLRIPRETPDGRIFRVASQGVRRPDSTRGDLLVSTKITKDADVAALRAALINHSAPGRT
ncbi:MAG: tetratricopeptide repeat protein [Streptosporangiaceae bacterium]|nr:tetratricopeptide repeat protein [Streptosporangiaceae bacterium]